MEVWRIMTKYDIAGNAVQIPTEVENERYVRQSIANLIGDIGGTFDAWYSSQSDCASVNRNAGTVLEKAIGPLVRKAVKMLSDQGVYSIDEKIFISKYLNGFTDEFYDVLDDMMDRISDIDDQLEEEQRYRQVRKASRGRVVGGGFGLGGALKGMATAGVMNAATGMAHSLGNAVGNMGSSISAGANKTAVYKNAKAPLREALINCGYSVGNAIRNALEHEANVKCKYVTATESAQAEAILQNYAQGRIPEPQRKNQMLQALMLNPYNTEIYEAIWNDFGDGNGDLRKMSLYFGCGLEQRIQVMACKYGDDVFNADCGEYLSAFNKTGAIVRNEANIRDSLKKMEQYCQEHDIEENLIPKISLCKELLQTADLENRTVEGVLYSTREIANSVKSDYLKFYKNIQGKDLTDNEQYQEICDKTYDSEEFNAICRSLCENERLLRTPERIRDNLWSIFTDRLDEATLTNFRLNVVERFGIFEQHEVMVRTITQMPAEEIPLFVIERSNNGKSGVMVTDRNLRIYSKGLLFSENQIFDIRKIKGIECVGRDKFMIIIDGADSVNVSFKVRNVTDEKQIIFADTFERAIQIVNNLYPLHLQNLYRILYSVVTCTCGTRLLPNEKVCPTCQKMLKRNGEFVETEYCPNCGSLLQKGKKFCSNCGFHLIVSSENDLNVVALIMQCPNCGNSINAGKKFCTRCGTKIQ